MGRTQTWRGRVHYEPKGNELFNVVMSLRYRGWKETEFSGLAFSSQESVKRAMNTLQLTADLARLGLPEVVSPDLVCRSSYGHANTIEVLFPNCDGRGVSFRSRKFTTTSRLLRSTCRPYIIRFALSTDVCWLMRLSSNLCRCRLFTPAFLAHPS